MAFFNKAKPIITGFKMIIPEKQQPEIPVYQGDYAKTIFLNWFSKPKEKPLANKWPQYFLYECGIRDCSSFLDQMIKDGLIKIVQPESKLRALKISDLKEILSNHQLPTTGSKNQLADRILENLDCDVIEQCVGNEPMYYLSVAGQEFVGKHQQYVILYKHKNWMISWKEFDKAHRPGEVGIYDTIWGLLQQRYTKEFLMNYGRNAYHSMAECALERGNGEISLSIFLQVLYIDLCFCPDFLGLAPGIMTSIRSLGDYYHIGMIDGIYKMRIPGRVCEKEEFNKIVISIINGKINAESVEKKLRKRGENI